MEEVKASNMRFARGGILRRLLTAFLTITLLSTLIVTSLHITLEYKHVNKNIEDSVQYIKDSYVGLLVNNVWHLDEEEIEIALKGILNQPQITYVKIEAANITNKSFGVQNKKSDKIFEVPLLIEGNEVGILFLHTDTQKIFNELKRKSLLVILIPEIVKIAIIAFIIFFIINKQLVQPLFEIVDFSKKIDISVKDGSFLKIHESSPLEFSRLAKSLNSLKNNAQNTYFELADYKNQLENLVEKRTEQYHDALVEAQQASLSKSQFLSNMSHELRTPLNSILLLSKLLKRNVQENLTEEDIKKADVINSAGNDLLSLINDILDLSKIESKKMPIISEEFDFASFCNSQLDQFRQLALDKNIKLSYVGAVKYIVKNDKSKLGQILKNLISNAIKFTAQGEVKLKLIKINKTKFALEVHDTGIGIPKEMHGIIFDKFEQGNKDILKNFGGTGLGLNITKNIVKLLDGEILLESTAGKGSVFRVELSDVEVSGVEQRRDEATREFFLFKQNTNYEELAGKNIYIVDDDERNLFSLKHLLESYGVNVFCFSRGEDLVLAAKSSKGINLFVVDLMMPEMDGLEVFAELKKNKNYANIPIIILTASTDSEMQKKCLSLGVDDYLNKPIDPDLLLSRMLKAIS